MCCSSHFGINTRMYIDILWLLLNFMMQFLDQNPYTVIYLWETACKQQMKNDSIKMCLLRKMDWEMYILGEMYYRTEYDS